MLLGGTSDKIVGYMIRGEGLFKQNSINNSPQRMYLDLISASLKVHHLHYHQLPCTFIAYMSYI